MRKKTTARAAREVLGEYFSELIEDHIQEALHALPYDLHAELQGRVDALGTLGARAAFLTEHFSTVLAHPHFGRREYLVTFDHSARQASALIPVIRAAGVADAIFEAEAEE